MIASPFIDAIGQDLREIIVPGFPYEFSLKYRVDNPRVIFRICLSTPALAFEKDCSVFQGGETIGDNDSGVLSEKRKEPMIYDGKWHEYVVHLQLNEELDSKNLDIMSWLWIGIDSDSGIGTACVDDVSLSVIYD